MNKSLLISILLLFLVGCGNSDNITFPYYVIEGRNLLPLYRIKMPLEWEQKEVDSAFTTDTTKPICECVAFDSIRITLHHFPNLKVPPQAQIARWQKQFTSISQQSVIPQAFSGFVGLKFEGIGILGHQEICMLGWSLQLAPEFIPLCDALKGADVTIKIVGPREIVEQHKEELEKFARSFELIEALP